MLWATGCSHTYGDDLEEHAQTFKGEVNFESVDNIVTSHLTQLETAQYDRQLMLDIYRNL